MTKGIRKHSATQSSSAVGSKNPNTEKTSTGIRSQSSSLSTDDEGDNETPTQVGTNNQTNQSNHKSNGTNGVKSSSSNGSKLSTMIPVSGSPRDIICGRGLHIMNHHGNHNLHLIVDKHRHVYLRATRKEKAAITRNIVQELKSTGVRFLRRFNDKVDDKWVEVDEKTAYKKVGHALRLRKSDHGQDFLKSVIQREQVDSQNSVHLISQRGTSTSRNVAIMPSVPQNTMMLHPPSLSVLSSSRALPLPPTVNHQHHQVVPTQAAIMLQHIAVSQPQPIVPLPAINGFRNVFIDPVLYSQVFTSTLAMMTQMQHQQSSSSFHASSADSHSSRRTYDDGAERRRGNR